MQTELLELCIIQIRLYPKLQAIDLCKMVYQGEFGPGHLLTDKAKSRQYFEDEYNAAQQNKNPKPIEDIGFGFCRLHMDAPLEMDEFYRIFELSAATSHGSHEGFLEKMQIVRNFCVEGLLPFTEQEFDDIADRWQKSGGLPFSHSPVFKEAYNPSYRVVKKEYCGNLFVTN